MACYTYVKPLLILLWNSKCNSFLPEKVEFVIYMIDFNFVKSMLFTTCTLKFTDYRIVKNFGSKKLANKDCRKFGIKNFGHHYHTVPYIKWMLWFKYMVHVNFENSIGSIINLQRISGLWWIQLKTKAKCLTVFIIKFL